MHVKPLSKALVPLVAAAATLVLPATGAHAYNPTGGILYQLGNEPCLKGRGNCAIYPKSAQLPSGRLVASFEKATVVPETGSADRETLPIYKSDDYGTSWQPLAEVKAPAYLSRDPRYAKYTSNWTNPYLYALPQDVGKLRAGTLLLASVVSGDDHFYREHKAADPDWTPSNDGDRSDLAIALFASTDEGVTWNVVNVVATGGWQGGSAGAIGRNIAAANTYKQVDPLWEPYLTVHEGKLVCYYSDENDYLGFDPATGVATVDPANDTAPDSHGQILVHKTWNGRGKEWSAPIVDVAGLTQDMGGGKTQIGGGRPGMTNVVPTTDGKWLLTFEYWGGGTNTRYTISDDPLTFYRGSPTGEAVTSLPVDAGSRPLATGGSPVVIKLPDGRLVYNASGSGNVWVNESGRGAGGWKEYQTPLGSGYSRNLQYVEGTGRIAILRNQGISTIAYAEVDLGHSEGAHYQLVNRKTGQVIGTGSKTNDANLGNADVPDVVLEDRGSAAIKDTQYWHVRTEPQGGVTLLNKSGGRAAAIWTGNATAGQRIGQWVDNSATGSWNLVKTGDGSYKLQALKNPDVYLTGASAGAALTLQNAVGDGSQEWRLVQRAPALDDLTRDRRSPRLIRANGVGERATVPLDATASDPAGTALHANTTGHGYLLTADGKVTDLGPVSFDQAQQGSVTLPEAIKAGTKVRIAVLFDDTPLMWDSAVATVP
ncbi:RICIN domain-containing protein [Nonomuraea sp. NPDC050451]|uniref:RICIN domain-containing protein n=1 Tax=Nonomuraea sp. NPDC050451 TaxID=3364364 RepID=UPI0037BD823E